MNHTLSFTSPILSRVLAGGCEQDKSETSPNKETETTNNASIWESYVIRGSQFSRSPDLFIQRQNNQHTENKKKKSNNASQQKKMRNKNEKQNNVQTSYPHEEDGESSSIPSPSFLSQQQQQSCFATVHSLEKGQHTINNNESSKYLLSRTEKEKQTAKVIRDNKTGHSNLHNIQPSKNNSPNTQREDGVCPVSRVDLPVNIFQLMDNYGTPI